VLITRRSQVQVLLDPPFYPYLSGLESMASLSSSLIKETNK